MSRAALLGATCLSGLALATSITPAVGADLILNSGGLGYAGLTRYFGSVIVGDTSGRTSLFIEKHTQFGNAVVFSNNSILGNRDTADDNQAIVSGTWNTNGNFILGNEGSGNTLTIQAGGKVSAVDSYIGYDAGSTDNIATVTGKDSKWEAGANLHVGYQGASNKLNILGGGTVTSASSWVGNEASAIKNIVTVSGAGSSWATGGEFILGKSGNENELRVSNGASVSAHWFTIGSMGSKNTFALSTGAKATSYKAYIGRNGAADDNVVTVSGGAQWDIWSEDDDGSLFVGYEGSRNSLEITTGGQVNLGSNGRRGSLKIGGTLNARDNGPKHDEGEGPSDNNLVITGDKNQDGKTRLSSGGLTLGAQGNRNFIVVFDGGILETWGNAQIGTAFTRTNSVTVGGLGSKWTVSGDLGIGAVPMSPGSLTAVSQSAVDDGRNSLFIVQDGLVDVEENLSVLGDSRLNLGRGGTLKADTLTLSDNSLLSIFIGDEGKSIIEIEGAAALDGDLEVKLDAADLQDNRYTVLTAKGGLNNTTFDDHRLISWSDESGLPPINALNADLEYTATGVFIRFDSDIGGDENLNINRSNVSDAINRYYNAGGKLPESFVPMLLLTGDPLTTMLSQTSGEVGSTGGAEVVDNAVGDFLGLLTSTDATVQPQLAAAQMGDLTVMPTADVAPSSGWTMWGKAFGGKASLPGDGALGSHDTDTDLFGLATGWDYALSDDATLGFAIAGGGTRWDLARGLGEGKSTFLQFGAHGTQRIGAGYLSVAGAYAWHWMETERRALSETLTADFAANSLAGRIEAGHRFGETGDLGLTPYGALAAQASFLPDYRESGGSAALAYKDNTATTVRSELGLKLDMTAEAARLTAGLAWAHDWRSEANVEASFLSLPGASFTVNGAEAPANLALVSAGAELDIAAQTTLSARFDGEFGKQYQSYGGALALAYNW